MPQPPPQPPATLADWTRWPGLRWGFLHTRELVPTARIARGTRPALPLHADLRPIPAADVVVRDEHTDAFLVLHRDRVIVEHYRDGVRPDDRHLLQSVSKSIAGTLTGILVAEGALDPATLVTDHVTELRGSSFEGATVRHVLDMRTGTAYSEDYDDPESDVRITEELGGWRPLSPGRPYATVHQQLAALRNAGAHGGGFAYRSGLTDLLAWILERATGRRYADLLGERLWAPMGAEHSADITIRDGITMADGGICTTLRDLGRFGLLHLGDADIAPPLVPDTWLQDTRRGEVYANQWWVLGDDRILARGIHGQLLWVDTRAQVVCVKLASHPAPVDARLREATLAAFGQIASGVGG